MYRTRGKIILASASPRRQAYLDELGLEYRALTAAVDETPLVNEKPIVYVARMAREKALVIMERCPEYWVIAADTTVFVNDRILDKPASREAALQTLMFLSGCRHQVATAFCVGFKNGKVLHQETVTTTVEFTAFSEATALAYIATGEPFDKAGAYAIQGRGAVLVRAVEGSFSNVVGLPLCELVAVLCKYSIIDLQ